MDFCLISRENKDMVSYGVGGKDMRKSLRRCDNWYMLSVRVMAGPILSGLINGTQEVGRSKVYDGLPSDPVTLSAMNHSE